MYKIVGADGKVYGPVSAEVLRRWLAEGRVNAQTQVLPEGAPAWMQLGTVPELASALASLPIGPIAISGVPVYVAQRTHPMALTGFILGLVAITIGLCCCYGLPFSVSGIIFSAIGLSQIKNYPNQYSGRGLAITGLVLSILSILLAVGLFALGFALSFSDIARDMKL